MIKIWNRKKPLQKFLVDLEGKLQDYTFDEKISLLACCIVDEYLKEKKKDNKIQSLTSTIYTILVKVCTPMDVATAIGMLSALLMNDFPDLIEILQQVETMFKSKDSPQTGLV